MFENKALIYLLLIITFSSCKEVNTDKKETKAYNIEEYYSLLEKDKNTQIIVIDTTCISNTKKAINDAKKGNYTYFVNFGVGIDNTDLEHIPELLSKFDIKTDSLYQSCFGVPKGFKKYCYQSQMTKEIEVKYGSNFIDSLKHEARLLFVNKDPDRIFSFFSCDYDSKRYPKKTEYREDYFKNFKYPKDYKFRNEKNYSYTTVDFIIHKDGSISDIKAETIFQNKANNKFIRSFNNSVVKFVKRIKWQPAKKAGLLVNSDMSVYIPYK